jgi:hypothetical protein
MVARFLQYVDVLPSPLDNAGERGGAAGTTDSTASGSLEEERGRVLLPFNLPSSCEYRPFHFLETQHVMLKKGVKFGDRTDITAKGNQPPWRNVTWK